MDTCLIYVHSSDVFDIGFIVMVIFVARGGDVHSAGGQQDFKNVNSRGSKTKTKQKIMKRRRNW